LTSLELKNFSFNNLTDPHDLEVTQEWVVDDFLPEGSLTMLSGESGSGKSTITLLLASAVAEGKPFLGHPTKQKKVIIIDRENGGGIYKERFGRLRVGKHENITYWGGWEPVEPQGPEFEPYLQIAKEHQPLMIFDSFIAFLGENSEQDASEVRRYTNDFRKLAQAGATVVFIHHTGKADSTKQYRGSSDIKASIDMGWLLTAKDRLQGARLTNIKAREGVVENIQFFLEDANLIVVDEKYIKQDDPDFLAVHEAVLLHPGSNQSQIIELVPHIPATRVRKILLLGADVVKTLRVTKGLNNASFYTAKV